MTSYRYLGSALTNANGVATFDYEGTGAGEIDVIASLDKPITDGSIVSETYSILDTIYADTMSSDTSSRYTKSSTSTLVFDTDHLLYTKGNGGNYIDLRNQQINNYKGKTITFRCKFNINSQSSDAKARPRIAVNNSFISSGDYKNTGEIIVENVEIPSDATIINFRMEFNSVVADGDTVTIDDWFIYES